MFFIFSLIFTFLISIVFTYFSFDFIMRDIIPFKLQHHFEKKIAKLLFFIFVFFLTSFVAYLYNFGISTKIGSLFEKHSYTAQYYIEMYDRDTENLIGTYPADIACDTDETKYYSVDKIYTPKGEILCDSDLAYIDDIYKGKRISINDSSIGPFFVVITQSKVNNKNL
jgi:hypothetical protein